MADQDPPVVVTPTQYTVSCVPESVPQHYAWALTVEYRGKGTWAVMEHGSALGTDGHFDYEPSPSSREDDWLQAHRFDLDTALDLALGHAPRVNVNGLYPADVIARHAAHEVLRDLVAALAEDTPQARPTREQVDAELARVDNTYSCTDELHRFLAAEVRALRADQDLVSARRANSAPWDVSRVCGDTAGPSGVGGECVLPAGHPHVDGIGGQWAAGAVDVATLQTISNLQAIIEWCETDAPGEAEFFRHDGWVVTVADLRRSVAALAARPAPMTADAIAELVRRMDKAERERDSYREMVSVARRTADERVADLQRELERREKGLMNALWRALDREPGTERDLIDSIRNLAAARGGTPR